jgi:hypothetical protein
MFTASTEALVPTVIEEQTSPLIFNFQNDQDDHCSVAFDSDSGFALSCFFNKTGSNQGDVYVASLFVSTPQPPSPVFWQNNTLQEEEAVVLEKQKTKKVIPGKIGQPYVPASPATGPKVSVAVKVNYVCERVI